MKDFKKLKIWQKGMDIISETYRFVRILPKEEKFGLTSQITRAAISISANIAEGSSRDSLFDRKRFLEYSLGSAYELETLLLSVKITGLIKKIQTVDTLLNLVIEEQKMLTAFLHTLTSPKP
jgi:four helix bundle protein